MKLTLELPDAILDECYPPGMSFSWFAYRRSRDGKGWEAAERDERLADGGPFNWVRLSPAAIKRGLSLMPKHAPNCFAHLVQGNADANVRDTWVQLAVFGEVRYG